MSVLVLANASSLFSGAYLTIFQLHVPHDVSLCEYPHPHDGNQQDGSNNCSAKHRIVEGFRVVKVRLHSWRRHHGRDVVDVESGIHDAIVSR